MKKLLLPLVFAVIAGVASSTAATFVNAKKASTLYAAHVADSVAKHVQDSTVTADSVQKEHQPAEVESADDALPMTPADSIRAAHDEATTLTAATKGLPDATDPKHGAATEDSHAAPAGHDAMPATKSNVSATKGKVITPRVVDSRKTAAPAPAIVSTAAPAPHAPASVADVLSENRIASLFSKMQSKDAAKILEQMSDSDVRVILSKMSDKQAAAVLIAFPAARAAAISRGESKIAPVKIDPSKPKPDSSKTKPDSSKTLKPDGEHK
ncbi:MAG: hypothetical protein ABI120_04570 [Gemmatimonadaceae bacterium]